jgi:hypothetical protein
MHVFSLLKGDIKVHYIQGSRNLPNLKKISTIVNRPPLKFPQGHTNFQQYGGAIILTCTKSSHNHSLIF